VYKSTALSLKRGDICFAALPPIKPFIYASFIDLVGLWSAFLQSLFLIRESQLERLMFLLFVKIGGLGSLVKRAGACLDAGVACRF
jgi:hypothetical protein